MYSPLTNQVSTEVIVMFSIVKKNPILVHISVFFKSKLVKIFQFLGKKVIKFRYFKVNIFDFWFFRSRFSSFSVKYCQKLGLRSIFFIV